MKLNQNMIKSAMTITPTETVVEQKFKTIIFLMTKAEAKGCLEARPGIIPEGYTGDKKAIPVVSGFDRNALHGCRVVGFSIPCNLAAAAYDAVEVPCGMRAQDRNREWQRVSSLRGDTRTEAITEFSETIKSSCEKQGQIPLRYYTCNEEARQDTVVEDLDF